ncbi:MAG: hypothetical protein OXE57_14840 [Alphaproteobacteria bacterium]|nr:hypothetical protein [Alphaproteobacteria bacterium]
MPGGIVLETPVHAQDILDALKAWGLKGGRARCPAHNGQDRNLAVKRAGDRVLMTCHSRGCSYSDIIKALDLDRPPAPEPVPVRKAQPERLDTEHSEFPYHDADGNVVVTIKRIDYWERGKARRQKRIWTDPAGLEPPAHGWPLYRLPALLAHPQTPLVIVEGERAAEAAQWQLEPVYQATTTKGGAGKAELADLRPVRGREVIVWPDADEPGRRHGADLVDLCRAHGASKVRLVATHGLPPGWDAADA